MKTLADLKRDAKAGKISGEMIIRCGGTDIPERLRGIRKIVDSNSVGITFLNADGKRSEMPIKSASLVSYDDDSLTIYSAGKRDLNTDELSVFKEWESISGTEEFRERERIDALSDGSSTYYQKKYFFKDRDFEYLLGYDTIRGKKYDFRDGKIIDNSIKGDIEMQYKIYRS